ncbi:erythromycin esterase family protein [Streptomyces sp. bgisy022]|uniref:erythromycin esterase family protein n=1 Tax=Streptomyces sp. bgisy022 TaxID=3413769 RepID=UPI003D719725
MATDTHDLAHAVDAAAVMALFPSRPQVLALGEPTHGVEDLLHLRNDLFRRLVEAEDYRTIALETDCTAGLVVDDYVTGVTGGTGALDHVMEHGFSHGWGASEANRALVRWMREHNENRPQRERLRFAGIDGPLEIDGAQSPRRCLMALHTYLAAHVEAALLPCTTDTLDRLIGPDERWTEPGALMDPARSVGRSAQAGELRLLADDLTAVLDTRMPHLVTAGPREDWHRARLHGRTATGLLRYHSWMADTSPARMPGLLATRDAMMADNLLALAERGPVLVHAHNSHLQRDLSTMSMWDHPHLEWWSAGALVSTRLGDRYGFLAGALGTLAHHGVGTPPPDTVEGHLHPNPAPTCLVSAPRLAETLHDTPPARRTSPYFGYAPLDPSQLPRIDGIVYLRDARQ